MTEVTELFFGDKVGRVRDPFGNLYWVQTRLHDLTEEEMYARMIDPEFIKAMEYVQGADVFPGRIKLSRPPQLSKRRAVRA